MHKAWVGLITNLISDNPNKILDHSHEITHKRYIGQLNSFYEVVDIEQLELFNSDFDRIIIIREY